MVLSFNWFIYSDQVISFVSRCAIPNHIQVPHMDCIQQGTVGGHTEKGGYSRLVSLVGLQSTFDFRKDI